MKKDYRNYLKPLGILLFSALNFCFFPLLSFAADNGSPDNSNDNLSLILPADNGTKDNLTKVVGVKDNNKKDNNKKDNVTAKVITDNISQNTDDSVLDSDTLLIDPQTLMRNLQEKQRQLESREADLKARETRVKSIEQSLIGRETELKKMRQELSDRLKELDVKEDVEVSKLAKVYASTKPKSAAIIMVKMEQDKAIAIFRRMSPYAAGRILNEMGKMDPDYASKLSEGLSVKAIFKK